MWFIIPLLVGVIVVAATSKSPRESRPLQRKLLPPAPPTYQPEPVAGSAILPGPIAVLGEILRIGQYPSPKVILCAIAEAESLGRHDLASDIVRVFVAPVVYQHLQSPLAPAPYVPAPYERGSCAPRTQADYGRGSCAPRGQADYGRGSCAPRPPVEDAAVPVPPSVPPQMEPRQTNNDEILEMLHADPKAFIARVAAQEGRRGPTVEVFPVGTPPPTSAPHPSPGAQPPVASPEDIAQMQEVAALQAMAPGSPLGGVPDDAWRQFVTRLEREPSTFNSSRHVGQYRQRRERLADLGIDPGALHGSSGAQRMALDADLSDAYRHASAGGLTECLGRPITVPGHESPQAISLSGLLGVIQCAGLEGAVGWIESSNDRRRYPHTTQVFLNTNGVF